jgi:hypothetical protein
MEMNLWIIKIQDKKHLIKILEELMLLQWQGELLQIQTQELGLEVIEAPLREVNQKF